MNEHRILDSLLGKLGLARVEISPGDQAKVASRTEPTLHERRAEEFEVRINSILKQNQGAVENRVFVIGLQKVRTAFIDKWEKSKERIHDTVSTIIASRISDQDMYMRRDDESYLIVFGALGNKEAQVKCTMIGGEILQRLVGRDSLSDLVDVKTVSVQEDGQIQLKDLPPLETIFDDDKAVSNKPESASKLIRPKSADTSYLDQVGFIFRPMLAVRTKVISTFLCIPVRDAGGNVYLSSYDILDDKSDPKSFLAVDILSLKKVAKELVHLDERNEKSLLGIPVHFETLADTRRRTEFIKVCTAETKDSGHRIVFEIVGLPEGIPQVRLSELVALLRPYCRSVIARFLPEHRNFQGFRTSGLHAVGVDVYSSMRREATLMQELDDFVKAANDQALKTYIVGVRTISLYTSALASGFDYAAGHALTSVAEAAGGAYVFKVDSPYLSILGRATNRSLPEFKDLDEGDGR